MIPIYGEDVSYLARPYIEQSRRMIVDRITREPDGTAFSAWLASTDLQPVFR